ncbi:MAG: EFR1 family ferrodoxin [Coriobacteriales bacterium]|jgi:ferredoxin
MILYFSGTGNSRHVAKTIAEATGDDIEDIAVHLREGSSGNYSSERPYVFVGPVYGGRYPRVMTNFIERSQFAGSRQAYFVATCASTPWVTVRYVLKLAQAKGFEVMGFRSIIMPQGYCSAGLTQSKEQNDKVLAEAEPKIAETAQIIASGSKLPEEQPGKSYMSTIMNPLMYATQINAKKFFVTEKCNGCGTCASRCPLSNIRIVDGKPTWGDNCTQCNACIGGCPQQAIEFGKATAGKTRYYLPD